MPVPPLRERITRALAGHRNALECGDFAHAAGAEELMNAVLNRLPRRALATLDPQLDARLTVR